MSVGGYAHMQKSATWEIGYLGIGISVSYKTSSM